VGGPVKRGALKITKRGLRVGEGAKREGFFPGKKKGVWGGPKYKKKKTKKKQQ